MEVNVHRMLSQFALADDLYDPTVCAFQHPSTPPRRVEFGANVTGNCFTAATSLLNIPGYRGIVEAASGYGPTVLDLEFVRKLTTTLRLGCAYDSGVTPGTAYVSS